MTRRRTLLRTALGAAATTTTGAALAAGGTGCGRNPAAIEALVTWSGPELEGFREVIREFTASSGRQVQVVPVGEQLEELLRARLDTDNPPDVAIGPVPGLLREYALRERHVVTLDPGLGSETPKGLRDVVTLDGNRVFGLWVKAAHKSLFWHRPDTAGLDPPPRTWAELLDVVRAGARAGRSPLAVGAADGWVLTDWFENALVGVGGGEVYDAVAKGRPGWDSPRVTDALTALAEMWSIPGALVEGARRTLLTEYEESVVQVFGSRRADLVFEGDFVTTVVDKLSGPPQAVAFRFPSLGGRRPLILGGDVAAVFTDSKPARELIEFLDKRESMYPWVRRGGYLSPNTTVPSDLYPGTQAEFAKQVAEERDVRFDLSDQIGGRLGGRQGRGMWQILQDFFREVTIDTDIEAAVRRAQRHLVDAGRAT